MTRWPCENDPCLRAIFDNAPLVIYVKDRDDRFRLVNRRFERLFRVSAAASLGKTGHDVLPQRLADAFAARDRYTHRVAVLVESEDIVPDANGPRTLRSLRFPLFNREGQVDGVCTIASDVTEQRRAEAENARLRREVADIAVRQKAILRDMLSMATDGRLRLCHSADHLPTPLEPVGGGVPLTVLELATVRARVRQAADLYDFPVRHREGFILAVGEAATNAVVHAVCGEARVYAGKSPLGTTVQVWVDDSGPGIAEEMIPRVMPGRGRSLMAPSGRGFCLMLDGADRLYLLTGTGGTTIVLEMDRPLPG